MMILLIMVIKMINEPNVLLSVINTKLRDKYESIDILCEDLDYSKEQVDEILNSIGYYYEASTNQYKCR